MLDHSQHQHEATVGRELIIENVNSGKELSQVRLEGEFIDGC